MIRATAESWGIKPITGKTITREMNFPLTDEQMKKIELGHIPDDMGDHWFMYCDEEYIRYYRSWTGLCVFVARYEKVENGYKICELTIPNDAFREDCDIRFEKESMLFLHLLMADCGGDSRRYWESYVSI